MRTGNEVHGPETISVQSVKSGGMYTYHVNQYSGDKHNSRQLLASGAKVSLYTNDFQKVFILGRHGYIDVRSVYQRLIGYIQEITDTFFLAENQLDGVFS